VLASERDLGARMVTANNVGSNRHARAALRIADTGQTKSELRIHGVNHIEFYVADAVETARFYRTAFGFEQIAEAGPETGISDRYSLTLLQGDIRLVCTSAREPNGPIETHLVRHGEGVRDVAFRVSDARQAFATAVHRGATPVQEPTTFDGVTGTVIHATIATFGDTLHSLVESEHDDALALGWRPAPAPALASPVGLIGIDHFAACVPCGELDHWSGFYTEVLGFVCSEEFEVRGSNGGMRLRVVELPGREVRCTMVEPLSRSDRMQITTFLDAYGAPGVQHLAFACRDIVRTVRLMRANGLPCIEVPSGYYDEKRDGTTPFDGPIETLRDLNILADRDDDGYLLQAFTDHLQERPTFFLEVIERRGTFGFAPNNIKGLFAAVECRQEEYSP